jgi:hypothetical protein
MAVIDQSELKDIYRRLRALGYDEAVFAFDYDPHDGPDAAHLGAEVLVANTENARQKRYKAGDGTSWRSQFIDDLGAGRFGPPPKGVPLDDAVSASDTRR